MRSVVSFPNSTPSAGDDVHPRLGLPGGCGPAQPAWIPDVVRDPNFPRATIAAREGLHGAFGFPILLRGEVLSVMEFFSREIRAPDEDLLSMLTSVGNQIGLFVDRRRAQEELDRFFTLSLDMLCIAGFDGYFKRVNPAWQRVSATAKRSCCRGPIMEFVHPDDRAGHDRRSDEADRAGEEVIYFENRYFHKDGTLRWLMWTSTPFPRAAGRLRAPRATSPSAKPPKKRWRATRAISSRASARSRSRPRGSRSSSRSWRSQSGAPKRRRKPRAHSSPT